MLAALRLEAPMPMAPLGMLLPVQGLGRATEKLASYLRQQARRERGAPAAVRRG